MLSQAGGGAPPRCLRVGRMRPWRAARRRERDFSLKITDFLLTFQRLSLFHRANLVVSTRLVEQPIITFGRVREIPIFG